MKKYFYLASSLLLSMSAWAVPARPGWVTKIQPDGQSITLRLVGDEFCHYWVDADNREVRQTADGFWQVVADAPSAEAVAERRAQSPMMEHASARKVGITNLAPRGLFILANFTDKSFQPENTGESMDEMMNGDNYTYDGAVGSARQYFSDQSNGQYVPVFDVVGPVTVNKNCSYYGGNDWRGDDSNPGDLIVEACKKVDARYDIDFTQYDNDNDGYIDFVYVIYAGKGEADGGGSETIWPHNWVIIEGYNTSYSGNDLIFDGKRLSNYACSGEQDGRSGRRNGIGTLVHEFGHVIGLPDFYDTQYSTNYRNSLTPGDWDVMDGGSYNGDGKCPPNYSPWEKYFFGWATPHVLREPGSVVLTTDYDDFYQLNKNLSLADYDNTTTQYFFANRQQTGWDAALPGHGMLCWKVNYNASAWAGDTPNNTANAPKYTIVAASGAPTVSCSQRDPFPGLAGVTECKVLSEYPLLNIVENADSTIAFDFIEPYDPDHWFYEVVGENCYVASAKGKVLRDSTLNLFIQPNYGYDILGPDQLEVTMGGEPLTFNSDYTYDNDILTIDTVRGRVEVLVIPSLHPFVVTLSESGFEHDTTILYKQKYTLPIAQACESPRVFIGWTTSYIEEATDERPTMVSAPTIVSDTTFFAVYATPNLIPADTSMVGDTLFSEDWSSYSNGDAPDPQVYSTMGSNTKIVSGNEAGGQDSPELQLHKSSGAITIKNIPTLGAATMRLTFASNKSSIRLSTTTPLISIVGTGLQRDIANSSGVEYITLKLTNNTSSLAYIDDILLVATSGSPEHTIYTDYSGSCEQVASSVENIQQPASSGAVWQKHLINGRLVITAPDGRSYDILAHPIR